MNKIKNKFLSFTLLASFLLSMINPTNYGLTTVYAAGSYTVKLEDFTNAEGVLTNFAPKTDISEYSEIVFPASITYTTDPNNTPENTEDDEEHTITPTYSSGIFGSDALAQKTIKLADGVKLSTKMQDTKATTINFLGNVTLLNVTIEDYFKDNKNIETVTGCDFLFKNNTLSASQFKNSSVKTVSFSIDDDVRCISSFAGTTLQSLTITQENSGDRIETVEGMFAGATITKDVLATVLNACEDGVVLSRFLQNANVSGFDTQAELVSYVAGKLTGYVDLLTSTFDTTTPVQGSTLDLSSFKVAVLTGQIMAIDSTAKYNEIIMPTGLGSSAYITSSKDCYKMQLDKTLEKIAAGSGNIKVTSNESIYYGAATAVIHGETDTTKYLSALYTFGEVFGTDTKYTTTEGGSEEFDMTKKPVVGETYDLYVNTAVTPDTPEDVEMDLGKNTVGTEITFEDGTAGTIGSGDTISLTATETTSAPDTAKKYINFKNVQVFNITVSNGTKNITEFKNDVEIEMPIPDDYVSGDIKVLDFHEGVDKAPIEITSTVDTATGKFKFKTKTFSTYAFLYNDSTGTTTNWKANIVFDDNDNSENARPTSLTLHIYVNDVEYKTETLTITGATNTVTVAVPQTVADENAEVSFDLDGAGNAGIAEYSGPVESMVSGVPTYTYTYGTSMSVLPIRVEFQGDDAHLEDRPSKVKVVTSVTYGTGSTSVSRSITTEFDFSNSTDSYMVSNALYPETLDGKAVSSINSVFPTIGKYTATASISTGTTQHRVRYMYTGGTTATTNLRVNFADVGHTTNRPDTITVTTVETFEDNSTRTLTNNITVDKAASYTNFSLQYDTVNDSGSAINNLVTTWPNLDDYIVDKNTTDGLLQQEVTYTYTDTNTTYTVRANFSNDITDTSTRPEKVTATTYIRYADGTADTVATELTVPKNTNYVVDSFDYSNTSAGGANLVSVTTTWGDITDYNRTVDNDDYTYSTATYTYGPSSMMTITATFNDSNNEFENRPDTLSVPVTITYKDATTKTLPATIDLKTSMSTTVTYPKVNNAGATAESATVAWPSINGYAEAEVTAASLTSQTATYLPMYYTKEMTVKFDGDKKDTSTRPESIDIDTSMSYKDGSNYDETVSVSISGATTKIKLGAPTYYNKSAYDTFTWIFPELTGYNIKESGSVVTYTLDTSTDVKTVTYTVKFSDNSNTAGVRPSALKVTLINTNDSSDTITSTLNISDPTTTKTESYTGTATKTKVNATYKISKVEKADGASGMFDKYTISLSDLTATLSHTPETTTVNLSATWTEDGDNADNTRPSNLSVTVKNGDDTVATATLNSDGSWKKDVSVNKYIKGVEAKYTYSFPDVSNYSKSVSETTATYKYTGTLSSVAKAKQAELDAKNGVAAATGTEAEDNTYNIDMFDWIDYANRYPDLKAAFGYNKEQLYAHYIHFGIAEGRIATWTGKYANVNEDILKAYFPNDYKYKTDLTKSSDKYSEITGDSSSSSSSSSGGTTEKATENTTITRNDDGTTTVKTVNGKTVTETTYDEDGNVIGTKTYATGDTNRNNLNITVLLIMLAAVIVIGVGGYDIYADEKKRKLLWSRVDK